MLCNLFGHGRFCWLQNPFLVTGLWQVQKIRSPKPPSPSFVCVYCMMNISWGWLRKIYVLLITIFQIKMAWQHSANIESRRTLELSLYAEKMTLTTSEDTVMLNKCLRQHSRFQKVKIMGLFQMMKAWLLYFFFAHLHFKVLFYPEVRLFKILAASYLPSLRNYCNGFTFPFSLDNSIESPWNPKRLLTFRRRY